MEGREGGKINGGEREERKGERGEEWRGEWMERGIIGGGRGRKGEGRNGWERAREEWRGGNGEERGRNEGERGRNGRDRKE